MNATGNGNARSGRDGKTGSSARAPSEPRKGPVMPRAPSYVISANRLATPIIRTNRNADVARSRVFRPGSGSKCELEISQQAKGDRHSNDGKPTKTKMLADVGISRTTAHPARKANWRTRCVTLAYKPCRRVHEIAKYREFLSGPKNQTSGGQQSPTAEIKPQQQSATPMPDPYVAWPEIKDHISPTPPPIRGID